MAPRQEPISPVAHRSRRAWVVTRSIVLQAAAVAIAAQLLLVVGVGSTGAVPAARTPLVFRVEGSRHDPDFFRACGVIKGLEDLYGKDRYTLHSVRQASTFYCTAVVQLFICLAPIKGCGGSSVAWGREACRYI